MAVFEFGTFVLDPAKRTLLRAGARQALTPKAFDLLVLLVEQRERVLSKEELLGKLWPSAFVEEANLSQQIFLLRRILDEASNEPSSIATVPRRGYRFVATVTERLQRDSISDGSEPLEPDVHEHDAVSFSSRTDEEPAAPLALLRGAHLEHADASTSSRRTIGVGGQAIRKWLAPSLVIAAGLAILTVALAPKERASGAVIRFYLDPPDHVRVGDLRRYGPAVISPDGRRLAFVGVDTQGRSSIWMRPLDQLNTIEVIGTEGAAYPFWSPDGTQLAYFAQGKLKKVRADGGIPDVLADAPLGRAGTWSPNGRILFVPNPPGPLQTVAAIANPPPPSPVTPDREGADLHPAFLPDGRRFLFIESVPPGTPTAVPFVGELNPHRVDRYSPITETESNVLYAAEAVDATSGYMLYLRSSALMAQPVDARTLEPRGEPILVASGVRSSFERWRGDFSASLNGVLVYRSVNPNARRLAWYDRRGNKLGDVAGGGSDRDVALSPDATQLAVHRFESVSPLWSDIWIDDLIRGTESRFTLEGRPHYTPVWARGSPGLFFVARIADGYGIYHSTISQREPRQLLQGVERFIAVTDSSPDGRQLLYQARRSEENFDLLRLDLTGGSAVTPFLQTSFNEVQGQFSPDGRWVAYVSNESSTPEVYLCLQDDPERRVQISANGGVQPRWRRDGRELFYIATDGRLMSVTLGPGSSPRLGTPVSLFHTHIDARSIDALEHFDYDVSPDGQRIITLAAPEPEATTPWTVLINWPAALGSQ